MPLEHQDVVGESEAAEPSDAANDVLLRQKAVPLRLGHVTDAAKPLVVCKRFERLVEPRRPQIHPADDALDEGMPCSEVEQKPRLVERLIRLYGHAAVEAIRRERAFEIDRKKIALDRCHVVGDPRVASRIVLPEVLVGVEPDHHVRHADPCG